MSWEQAIYAHRFAQKEQYRSRVWSALVSRVFQPYVRADGSILDLGCGYGEFINNIRAAKRYAMDANPDARIRLVPDVEFIEQDSSKAWPLADGSLDAIFSSNFFEHLATKEELHHTLRHAHRGLREGEH